MSNASAINMHCLPWISSVEYYVGLAETRLNVVLSVMSIMTEGHSPPKRKCSACTNFVKNYPVISLLYVTPWILSWLKNIGTLWW